MVRVARRVHDLLHLRVQLGILRLGMRDQLTLQKRQRLIQGCSKAAPPALGRFGGNPQRLDPRQQLSMLVPAVAESRS